MKIYKKLSFLTTLALVLFISCSKSDNPTVASSIAGGEIARMQIVTVALPDTKLTENTYTAKLDGATITMSKYGDTNLQFIVPSTAKIGVINLVIPALNNATIGYTVKETMLVDTPEVTIAGLNTNLDAFALTLDDSPESANTKNNIASFTTAFSKASAADKITMALFYKANKATIDGILLFDSNKITGRMAGKSAVTAETEKSLLLKLKTSLFFIGVGTLMIDYGDPSVKLLGVLVSGTAVAKSVEYGKLLIALFDYTESLIVDNILGINNKTAVLPSVAFQDNVARNIVFNTSNRQLIASDAGNTHSEVVAIFDLFKSYNDFAGKVNGAINYINSSYFSPNFSTLPLLQIPATSSTTNVAVNADTFSHITFSISNPNLSLVTATLQSDGQLNIKVKIIGTPATTPVVSDLNYTYNDAFSSFTGKLRISVDAVSPCENNITSYPTVAIGSQVWMQKDLNVCKYRNGDDIPLVTDPTAWSNLTTGACCYYEDNTANGPVYVKLYNWYAVNDPRGLAPLGYHIPNDNEWTTLTTFLGGTYVAGGKMKATTVWISPNYNATNSSGFTGLPSGFRSAIGETNSGIGGFVGYWSASDYNTSGFCYHLSSVNDYCPRYVEDKKVGLSVRCLRD